MMFTSQKFHSTGIQIFCWGSGYGSIQRDVLHLRPFKLIEWAEFHLHLALDRNFNKGNMFFENLLTSGNLVGELVVSNIVTIVD